MPVVEINLRLRIPTFMVSLLHSVSSALSLSCQLGELLFLLFSNLAVILATLPYYLLLNVFYSVTNRFHDSQAPGATKLGAGIDDEPAVFYEGRVTHTRKKPVVHELGYDVRMAVISLDNPPAWYSPRRNDTMTADQARAHAGTDGPVRLLTHPEVHGYSMNPISVYYCYDSRAALKRCIAEVTNTPWGERVTFSFDPEGAHVPKALHVSPFMDMENTWHLVAPCPTDRIALTVRCTHPTHGAYFDALFVGRRAAGAMRPNESSGLRNLIKYGFLPQRVAAWIYLHAIHLIRKGVAIQPPPGPSFRPGVEKRGRNPPSAQSGQRFWWREARGFPWR